MTTTTRFRAFCLVSLSCLALAASAPGARAEGTTATVTVTSPAGSVSQQLPAGSGEFALGVPLARNSVNKVVVTATDSLGHTASRDVFITQVSLDAVVVSQVTVEPLSPEEIEDLVNQGVIDLDDPENYNVSQFTIVITIDGKPVEISVPVAVELGDQDSGGDAPMPMPDADNAGGNPPPAPREIIVLLDEISGPALPEPVPLPGVLILEGRIKSLKEFFAIRLLLLNTSGIFTLSNVSANVDLPPGALTPILPSTGVVAYGDILPGDGGVPGQSERQFIVRGDRIGTHEIRVNFGGVLTGPGIPEDAPIPFSGSTRASVQVKGPPTFQVQVFHPDEVVANEPYDLRVDITNTGDMPALYASLDLDAGADGKLVRCTTEPPDDTPVCHEIDGPDTRSLGHVYPGRTVSQTFTIKPGRSGRISSCVGASDQNISLFVHVGTIGCLVGKYPPEDAGAAGPTVSVVPVGNALGVGVHSPVTAFFSTRMDTGTITTDTFRVFDGALDAVPGRVRFTETFGRTVAIWQPHDGVTNALSANTNYIVQFTQGIRDLAGRTLASPWLSTFTTTGDDVDDETPPEITLSVEPPVDPNDVIPGQIALVNAYVADQGSGVARVEARLKDLDDETATYELIDQESVFAGELPPYMFAIDSGRLRAARHYQLLVTAYDAMANARDATLSLVVGASSAPPAITLPDDPASPVLQGISVDVTPASVGDIVKEVRFFVDGAADPAKTVFIAPWKASLPTLELALGAHTVRAVAVDGLGRTAEDTLSFSLAENRNMPVVSFGNAVDGAVHPSVGSFTVHGTASDPVGFRSILWYLDARGAKSDALASGNQPFLVDTTGLADGTHRILGVATNRLGVTNDPDDPSSVLEFVVVTPSGTTPPDPPVVTSVTVPSDGRTTVAGHAPAGARVDVTNTRPGLTASVFAAADGTFSALVEAASGDSLSLVVVDYRIALAPSAPATAVVPAPPVLLRVEVAPDAYTFTSFGWTDLSATAFYDDGSHADVTSRAHWTTSAAPVATVSGGRVVAHANGAATITAVFDGSAATCAIAVDVVVLASITVEPSSVLLTAIGAEQALTVVGHFSDGSTSVLATQNSFSTADARVATADATGIVRAARRGATVVTVAHTGVAPVTVPVTVETAEDLPPVATITSPPDGRQVERGEFVEIVVDAQDVDGGVSRVMVRTTGETSFHDEHQVSPPAIETTETFGLDVESDAAIGGTITVQAFSRDTAAQFSAPSTITLHVVDHTAPTVTIDAPAPDTAFVPGATVSVVVSAADAVGVSEVRYETVGAYVTGERRTYQPPVAAAQETFSFTLPAQITDGEVFIHAYAKDASGNEGHAAPVRIVVQPDTTPPSTRATAVSDPAGGTTAAVSFEVLEGQDDLDHVELYFRRDGIGTFNRFTDADRGNPEGTYPAGAPILFDSTKTGGDGAYEFFTVGVDASGNREAPPVDDGGAYVADQAAGFAAGTAWAVISTPTLLGAGDLTHDGSNVRVVGTTLTIDGHHAFHNLDLRDGAVVTHPETTTVAEFGIDLSTWTISIDATSRIDVAGRGYLGGNHGDNSESYGRTRGNLPGSTYRSGGSYGGPGAAYGGTPSPTYGYVTDPVDLGSGGSSGACGRGADGGGRIALEAVNVASNGRIDAAGEAITGCQPGSGSGGAIKIVATTVSGTGAITANGGAGEVGGGGGRVLIEYVDIATLDTNLVRALGGAGRNAQGGNGSVTLRPSGSGAGTLVVDGQGTVTTWSPLGIPPGYVFDEIVLRNSARVMQDEPIVVGDLLKIETNSILTHSTEHEAGLSITARRVIVDASSSIDVSGRGFRGGNRDGNPESYGLTLNGQPGSRYRSGGSYGGRGASYSGPEGALYGHPANPVYLGSGGSAGACGAGFNGGGRVTIDAEERVEIQGSLLAEGSYGTGCQPGSGSGGSIKLATSLLLGNGRISADGGAGEVGGGGGRIAITYAHLGPEGANFDGTRSISAQGGHGRNAWGSAGTILFKGPTQPHGDLYVDENVVGATSSSWSTFTRIGYGHIAALTDDTLTVDGQVRLLPGGLAGIEIAPNIGRDATFTIVSNTDTTITVDVTPGTRLTDVAAVGDTYAAVYRFDNVLFRRGGHLNLGDRLVVGDTVTIDEYGLLTHYAATMANEPRLELRADTIDVRPTGRIDVTGRGYLGGDRDGNDTTGQTLGNVDGARYRSAGSYGGIGATYSGGPSNAPYGDQTDPDDLGAGGSSGACGGGFSGGGRMKLRASRIIVDGALRADGAGGTGCQPGSGAGGTIHLTTDDLSGAGTISASGGGGEVGGGGGRIALYYGTTTFPETNIYAVGGQGRNTTGGNGTVYLKSLHQALGTLVIDGHDADTPDYLSPIPAGAAFDNLTLRNKARVTADAPLDVRGALDLRGNSRLYHTAESESGLTIHADTMTIDATSAVDVTGLGYPGGQRGSNPESYGLTLGRLPGPTYRSAGSHGGYGAIYSGSGGGQPYGSPFDPRALGAGGSVGACGPGFNGGGLVSIQADTSLTVDGVIRADGNGGSGCQSGSGAGGSIRIATPLIRGTGSISANGGAGEVGAGGGRIRIDYETWGEPGSDLRGNRNVTAFGGHGNNEWGSAGTVLLVRAGQALGDLYVDDGMSAGTTARWTPLTPVGFGRSAFLTADTLTIDPLTAAALPLVPGGLVGAKINPNLAQSTTFRVIANTADTLTVDVSGGTYLTDVSQPGDPYAAVWRFDSVFLRGGGFLVVDDLLKVDGTLSIDESSVVTHRDATTTWGSRLDIDAARAVITANSSIDVSARGYLGGGYAGNGNEGRTLGNVPGSTYRAAGSYGGLGGGFGGTPNPVYGNADDPNELGSGGSAGACGRGGDGGGLLRLHAGSLVVDGAILADGEAVSACQPGSGSGGGLRIVVDDALSGTGVIRAAGGAGDVGGGGGRVAVSAGSSTLPAANVTAPGGAGHSRAGEDGTVRTP